MNVLETLQILYREWWSLKIHTSVYACFASVVSSHYQCFKMIGRKPLLLDAVLPQCCEPRVTHSTFQAVPVLKCHSAECSQGGKSSVKPCPSFGLQWHKQPKLADTTPLSPHTGITAFSSGHPKRRGTWSCWGKCREGTWGWSDRWRQAERVGVVWPGKEKAPGRP